MGGSSIKASERAYCSVLYGGELTPLQRRRLREQRRRTYFRRRMIALAIVLSFIAGIAAGAVFLSHHGSGGAGEPASAVVHQRRSHMLRQSRPAEIRGVHVTMP